MSAGRVHLSSVRRALPFVLAIVLLSSTQASAESLDPVIVEPGEQFRPFGNGTWHTWTLFSRDRFKALAQRTDGTDRVRLNAAGTEGLSGGLDPGDNVVIYQQFEGNRSDIWLYDLETDTRSKAQFVNSRRWEWNPRISDTWILFTRDVRRGGVWYTDMWAVQRSDGTAQMVGSWRIGRNTIVRTGTVGEQWATWTVCRRTCRAYVRDLLAEETTQIPAQGAWSYYAPALDEANDRVYFVKGRSDECGNGAQVRELPISDLTGASTLVIRLPDNIDTGVEASVAPNLDTGMNDYLFERWRCGAREGDIWKVSDVSPIPDM